MKQLTEYDRVAGYLDKIFSLLNETYFENALSKPVITIQSTPRAYGHCSVYKIWKSGDQPRHELNIGAGTLTRPIENVVATMLHEMVHLYNLSRDVQDCSRNCTYHNKIFKEEAEKRDLIITHDNRIGWSVTEPSEKLVEWCIARDLSEIRVERADGGFFAKPPKPTTGDDGETPGTETPGKRPSSTRKYQCPRCRASVRATRDLLLYCGACSTPENLVALSLA